MIVNFKQGKIGFYFQPYKLISHVESMDGRIYLYIYGKFDFHVISFNASKSFIRTYRQAK